MLVNWILDTVMALSAYTIVMVCNRCKNITAVVKKHTKNCILIAISTLALVFICTICTSGTQWKHRKILTLAEITDNYYCIVDIGTKTWIYNQLGEERTDLSGVVTKCKKGNTQIVWEPIEDGAEPYVCELSRLGKFTTEYMYVIHVQRDKILCI
jgi:hypothetical protein